MPQTKQIAANSVNVSRSDSKGAGTINVAKIGKWGSFIYRAYIDFAISASTWSDVGTIVKAELALTTSDNFGSTSDHPRVVVRRLAQAFTEGSGTSFTSGSYRNPTEYNTPAFAKEPMATAVDDVTLIDITGIVKSWAPTSIPGGRGQSVFGVSVKGTSDANEQFEFHTDEATTSAFRPYILLTYEYGKTVPDTPTTGLSPDGAVASIDAFEADFSDTLRPTDLLGASEVQVYLASGIKSGDADTDDTIDVTAHGFVPGQEVWFLSLTGGTGLSLATRYYVRSVVNANSFKVSTTPGGANVNITNDYSALTVARPIWTRQQVASDAERLAGHSMVLPTDFHPVVGTSYKWRIRQKDNELPAGVWSGWSALVTFSVTNTDPDAPSNLSPDAGAGADDLETLNGVVFRGDFTDADVGDTLLAYQLQLSDLSSPSDPNWDDPSQLMWDSGKQYVLAGGTGFEAPYGGHDLTQGTWYWRARVWDNNGGLSDWSYASIVLLNDFDAEPGSQTSIQIDPKAPWRIRIREMKFNSIATITGAITGNATTNLFTSAKNHGLTAGRKVRFSAITGGTGLFTDRTYWVIASGLAAKTFRLSEEKDGTQVDFSTNVTAATLTAVTTRGPGNTIAIIENAKSVGASIVYNSPGEAHFTLPIDHPSVAVIEPRQVHYGIDFYTGDGWRETFAGLVWDIDATEREVVYPCLDYLALFDTIYDNRYYPSDPDRASSKGGSKYVNATISSIVSDQLNRAIRKANSPVGFIALGAIDAMAQRVTLWSTMQPTLSFVGGLIDSAREGSGRKTRISVKRTGSSSYSVVVESNPGVTRDNLRLRYGELVNGYRVIVFGDDWASVTHGIGRTREGTQVIYRTASAPGIDPRIWGNIEKAIVVDNVSDPVDLTRRLKQEAIKSGKLGQSMAIAVRTSFLKPLDGYNICDELPVQINHGAINTANFGSGYFNIWALAWEAGDDASQQNILTLLPREDTTAPAEDIVDATNISTQQEWQVGWTPPDPLTATARYWLDQTTGIVYFREDVDGNDGITGEAEP